MNIPAVDASSGSSAHVANSQEDLELFAADEDTFLDGIAASIARRGILIAGRLATEQGTHFRYHAGKSAVAFVHEAPGRAFRIVATHDFVDACVRLEIAHLEFVPGYAKPFFMAEASTLEGGFKVKKLTDRSIDSHVTASGVLRRGLSSPIPFDRYTSYDEILDLDDGLVGPRTLEMLRSVRAKVIGPVVQDLRERVGPIAERLGSDWVAVGRKVDGDDMRAKGEIGPVVRTIRFHHHDNPGGFEISHHRADDHDVVSVRLGGEEMTWNGRELELSDVYEFALSPVPIMRLSTLLNVVRNLESIERTLDSIPTSSSEQVPRSWNKFGTSFTRP